MDANKDTTIHKSLETDKNGDINGHHGRADGATDYGYIWADWLYGRDKDKFMVAVYNDCHVIDNCQDPPLKALKLLFLQQKIRGCRKPWAEGVQDFIDFEIRDLTGGNSLLCQQTTVGDKSADEEVLETLQAAYLHGAFRGICRTQSGAEWISQLGEFCAAAVHQGFKSLRKRGVSDWELPRLGESWCKGVAMWGLVCLYVAVDIAGEDEGNEVALERMHTIIAAHHYAGLVWTHYRGVHPHQWWNSKIGGRAPSERAIRKFGASHSWAETMIDVLVRGANHVNTWASPPFDSVHFPRMRGVLIWDHTPRLKSRLIHVCDEIIEVVGDMSESEGVEFKWRAGNWISTHTVTWHGKGDSYDRVSEISILGALVGVLRESRPHVTADFVERIVNWSRERIGHLSQAEQDLVLDKVKCCMEIRGRLPGAVKGYASGGTGPTRFIDGVWDLSSWCCILSSKEGGKEVPLNIRELVTGQFNALNKSTRIAGVDFAAGQANEAECPVCVGDALFRALVDNRPGTGVNQCTMWGAFLYCNLGLGNTDDLSLAAWSSV